MSKNILAIAIATLFLIGSIVYNYSARKSYEDNLNRINTQIDDIKYIKNLKRVWSVRGIKKKINKALSGVPAKSKKVLIKRRKATISLKSLNERTLNTALSKLASLPINFRELKVDKSGNSYELECKCDW